MIGRGSSNAQIPKPITEAVANAAKNLATLQNSPKLHTSDLTQYQQQVEMINMPNNNPNPISNARAFEFLLIHIDCSELTQIRRIRVIQTSRIDTHIHCII
jgi:hypothetical protein